MTKNGGDENRQRVELVPHFISSFGLAAAIFLFFFFCFEVSESDTYIVSFQGKSTFEDDDLAATVSNNNEITIYILSNLKY